jgi:predicted Zn-dependent protease
MREKQWTEAESKIAELKDLLPEDDRDRLDTLRLNVLFGKEDYKAAYELAAKISAEHANEPMLQNELAWQIATDPKIKQRDLKLAETIANRANEGSKGKDPGILDTVARVKFLQGKKDEALALQQKAIGLADGDMKAELEKTLEQYKSGDLSKAN